MITTIVLSALTAVVVCSVLDRLFRSPLRQCARRWYEPHEPHVYRRRGLRYFCPGVHSRR